MRATAVFFSLDPAITGLQLSSSAVPWDLDDLPHVIWEDDDYVCVLEPEYVQPLPCVLL